ncbi:hypothetical protein J608_6251, partial [Acinetobacter baumannii 1288284]
NAVAANSGVPAKIIFTNAIQKEFRRSIREKRLKP